MRLSSFPHYIQLKNNDCGPTCLKIISKYWGKTIDIAFARNLCNPNNKGVRISDLSLAGESLGFKTMTFEISFDQLTKRSILPCIAFLDERHFVVIYKITAKYIYISDPATRKKKCTYGYFKTRFLNTKMNNGTIICLEPQAKFYNTNSIGKDLNIPLSYLRITIQHLKYYRAQLVQLTIIMVLITLLQGVTPFIFRSVLDVGVDKKNIDFINIMFITNIILMLSTAFASVLKDLITRHIGIRFSISIVSNYLIKLLSMPLSFFNSLSSGEILNKVKDHENIKNFVLFHFINFSYSILSFLIFGLILYFFSLTVFLIFFFFTLVYITWILCFKKLQEKLEWSSHYLHSKNNSFWIETIYNIADIKSYNYEYHYRKKWEEIQVSLYHEDINSVKIRNIQETGSQVVNGIKNIIITFFCARSVVSGDMTFGMLISIQFMIGFLNSPIHQLINFIQSYPSAKQSFLRLNEIHSNNQEQSIPDYAKYTMDTVPRSIDFNKMYFKYAGNNNYTLKNISLSVPYGKTTALIGKSGSGKSSLIKLMLGLYQPLDGELSIGGILANNINMKQWRNQCSVVLQEGKMFNDSVLNNIILNDEEADYKKIGEIVKMVELNDVLKDLPQGYHSIIGEKGRNLSQGQKQRILLARALYKEPNYLFLDEATSALDVYNESIILKRIMKYMKNKTLVIATHRINTIENVDQIIVMNDGMVIEQGTHDLLTDRKGIYYAMCSLQQRKNNDVKNKITEN